MFDGQFPKNCNIESREYALEVLSRTEVRGSPMSLLAHMEELIGKEYEFEALCSRQEQKPMS